MIIDRIGEAWFANPKSRLSRRAELAGFEEPPVCVFGWLTVVLTIAAIAWSFELVFGLIGTSAYGALTVLVLVFFVALSLVVLGVAGYVMARFFFEVRLYQRVSSIEKGLPGYLREFSTNLRAGEEFVDAFERAITPSLGPLGIDIDRLVIRMRAGDRVADVLASYTSRYDSYLIEETFSVIREAYVGGGGLAPVLDRIADHLDVIDQLKKEAVASIANYMIFMTIVAVIIAPLLFALSYNMLELLQELLKRVAATGSNPYLPAFVTQFNVSLPDFVAFSRICTGVIAGSAAAIIGTVRSGNVRGSSALIVMYILGSLVVYEIALILLKAFFGVLFAV